MLLPISHALRRVNVLASVDLYFKFSVGMQSIEAELLSTILPLKINNLDVFDHCSNGNPGVSDDEIRAFFVVHGMALLLSSKKATSHSKLNELAYHKHCLLHCGNTGDAALFCGLVALFLVTLGTSAYEYLKGKA
eukprot:scaffold216144_cov21-Prasinocladus_malaysianus.AAC.1